MDIHNNARLTPHSRADLVRRVLQRGETPKAVATAFGVSTKTVRKWVARLRDEGPEGLRDRSSRPHKLRQPTSQTTRELIVHLRRQRVAGQQIARDTGVASVGEAPGKPIDHTDGLIRCAQEQRTAVGCNRAATEIRRHRPATNRCKPHRTRFAVCTHRVVLQNGIKFLILRLFLQL